MAPFDEFFRQVPWFSLNDVRVHSRHASVLTLQGYIDVHNAAKTRRAIADLVANALTSLNCDE